MATAVQERPAAAAPAAAAPAAATPQAPASPPAAGTPAAAPVSELHAPAAAVPAQAATGIQRGSLPTRLRAWFRLAYTDQSSREHQTLIETIIWAVIVSVVVTVLQHDHDLDVYYHTLFRVIEGVVFATFATDYAANLYFAESKRGYAFSFAGIIDLLAILPSVLILWDLSAIKFLRGLRFLRFVRILQVVRAVQTGQKTTLDGEERHSLILDLQLSVIGISALLLLVPDDRLRNLLLVCTLLVAITTGIRRWLVAAQHPTVSVVVLLGSIITAVMYAQELDGAGEPEHAVWLLVGTVLVTLVTWFQIEAPAGGL